MLYFPFTWSFPFFTATCHVILAGTLTLFSHDYTTVFFLALNTATKTSPTDSFLRLGLRQSHVLSLPCSLLVGRPPQPKRLTNQSKVYCFSHHNTTTLWRSVTMVQVQKSDRQKASKCAPTKRNPIKPGFSCPQSSSPSANPPRRRASLATSTVVRKASTSSAIGSSLAAVKSSSSSTRPEWIAPPGRYSPPSQIPAPKFVTSSVRKNVSPRVDNMNSGNSGGLGPVISVSPKTFYPRSRKSGAGGTDASGPIITKASHDSDENSRGVGKDGRETGDTSPKGLGLSFGDPPLDNMDYDLSVSAPTWPKSRIVDVALPSASSCGTFITAYTTTRGVKGLVSSTDDEKHDSLSPCISPTPSPSPSVLHPYISGVHILPSCTSGSLTHRLTCGHLIMTPNPEICAFNCWVATPTFAAARLKAQGFVANIRGLDEEWRCPVCAEAREGEGDAETGGCVGVLGREMLG